MMMIIIIGTFRVYQCLGATEVPKKLYFASWINATFHPMFIRHENKNNRKENNKYKIEKGLSLITFPLYIIMKPSQLSLVQYQQNYEMYWFTF